MRSKNRDLHGAAPTHARVALLLIDVINAMRFPGGDKLARQARGPAQRIAALKARAKRARIPVIYANDNYGQWRSDFRTTLANALRAGMPGREISQLLAPQEDDYFVLKPKHSAFYGSALELLLSYLGAECLVIAGFAADSCVQFTAQDAFLRDYELVIVEDGVASETALARRRALERLESQLGAHLVPAARIDLARLRRTRHGARS